MLSHNLAPKPSYKRCKVGNYIVTLLSDGHIDGSFDLLSGVTPSEAQSLLEHHGEAPQPRMNINAYIVQTGSRTILIDSGAGGINAWGGFLLKSLTASGIAPSEIDTILLTHAHPDHIGGLAGAAATPTLPNVQQFFIHQDELAFWQNDTIKAGAPDGVRPFFDAAQNVFSAYKEQLVPFTHSDILTGITAIPLPGHTIGHTGYLIADSNEALLIWGDIVHFPHIQIPRPEVTIAFDIDPTEAARTRKTILEKASSENLLVSGMHFNTPTLGKISHNNNKFALHYHDLQE
ncbi:Zn-dependent hydrolase [Neokomagataea thailandica NBRC 106555]|uniref:MBL fold metallo-hydrolase n=2 Tax=Neokomagataea TaxID=1223423 RepID=A0A4Y6V9W9_9PROT|nr:MULTISPECIES: MBL fold metallo-hydrolase [Neokomagataea]QDH25276.1 MBL fold metallo-hydrolase [Neokomagataea tanensis]GBR54740.1 Zn-dependent hydrolase [Neokomagataea thailandica NBRC 106555]